MSDYVLSLDDWANVANILVALIAILSAIFAYTNITASRRRQRIETIIRLYESIDPCGTEEDSKKAWDIYYDILNSPCDKIANLTPDQKRLLDPFVHFFDSIGKMVEVDKINPDDLGLLRFDIMHFYRSCAIQNLIAEDRKTCCDEGYNGTLRLHDGFEKLALKLLEKYR